MAHVSRTFNTIESCRQAFRERRPDVLLLDISIPDGDGAAFCQEVIKSCPKVKVVAVTIHDEYSVIRRITDLGIHGYVLKSSTVDTLLEAIVSVWQGRRYISAEAETILRQGAAQAVSLTAVEQSILRLVCDGMTNPQIAAQLNLSTETVNWYRKRLLAKFSVNNTVSLVRQALKEQLV